MDSVLGDTVLGKATEYISVYTPSLLHSISRSENREHLGIDEELPFQGVDIWNAYEVSWLDNNKKPQVAVAEIHVPCSSNNIIESKSLKLYLNSLNQTSFTTIHEVTSTIESDLSVCAKAPVLVSLIPLDSMQAQVIGNFPGDCLDQLNVSLENYSEDPQVDRLQVDDDSIVRENLFTHLFKSNCPVTGQPDWASVFVSYSGRSINHQGLLEYLISYREHNGFHENCVEKIFMDIMRYCYPEQLTVYARFLRRGGLDINPFRSNFEDSPQNIRLVRQ